MNPKLCKCPYPLVDPYCTEHEGFYQRKETVSDKLSYIRHSQIITDPFPDHTKRGWFRGLMDEPREISIWEAYRLGYQKAYDEIQASIGHRELK